MIIRKEQMCVLDKHCRRTFSDEVARNVRAQYPDEVVGLSESEVCAIAAKGLLRGEAYGFRKKYSLAMFIQLLFLASIEFDSYPPVRYLLNHPAIPPDARIDAVLQAMRDADWDEIRRRGPRPTP
jgi:hypothetical protein